MGQDVATRVFSRADRPLAHARLGEGEQGLDGALEKPRNAGLSYAPGGSVRSTHTVRNATVGGIRDARTAGMRPANAPIRMAEAMPPDHASAGMTMAQPFALA
jgi:hypothetical protein